MFEAAGLGLPAGGGGGSATTSLDPGSQLLRDAGPWNGESALPAPWKVEQAHGPLIQWRGTRAVMDLSVPPVLFHVLFPAPRRGNLSPSEGRDERRSDLLFYSIMPVSRETNYGALLY